MKKIGNKIWIPLFVCEAVALIAVLVLSTKNDYLWIAVVSISALLVITAYLVYVCFCNSCKIFMEDLKRSNIERDEENKKVYSDIIEKLRQNNEEINKQTSTIYETMNEMVKKNSKQISQMSELFEKATEDYSKTTEKLETIITDMGKQYSEVVSSVNAEIIKGTDTLTIRYEKALSELSQQHEKQIDEWNAATQKLLVTTTDEVNSLIVNVKDEINSKEEESSAILNANISNTHEAIQSVANETQIALREYLEKIERLNENINSSMSGHIQSLMSQMATVSKNNVREIEKCSETTLTNMIERIVSENEQDAEKRKIAFEGYLCNLEETYSKIIASNIIELKKQISESIADFIAENKQVLKVNNERAGELISAEKSFVTDAEASNIKFRESIDAAFLKYSESVEKNILDMTVKLTDNLRQSTQSTVGSIETLSVKNAESINQLSGELKQYSDSLVEKSAVAIGNVQADNNLKIQELCNQMNIMVAENVRFSAYCKEIDNFLKDKIADLIEDRDRLVMDLQKLSNGHVTELDLKMQKNIMEMAKRVQELNIENSSVFSESMNEYRDRFVEANASALANVQIDNVNSITDANEKVSQLATNMKKFQEQIVNIVYTLQSIIKDGIDEKKAQDESFDENMNALVDDKLSEYNAKLQTYNDTFTELGSKITEVMNACQSNTSKYEETLKYIIKTQQESNSLSEKDLELLKKFMKR